MRVLVTADWHQAENPRDYYRHRWQKQLRSFVRKYKVDLVLVLGDLTEEKDRHSAWLVNMVVDHLYKLTRLCPVVVIRGNHDGINPDHPFWGFLGRIEGLAWVNGPADAKLLSLPLLAGLRRVLLLPHSSNPENDWSDIDFGEYDWVFAHNTFAEAISESGFKLKGVPTSIFSPRNRVISGDVHVPQSFGNITYVGAPYTVDFGDDFIPRVLLIDDLESGSEPRSIECGGPQKILIEIEWDDNDYQLISKNMELIEGDIVKFHIHIPREKFPEWPGIQKRLRDWASEGPKIDIYAIRPIISDSGNTKAGKRVKVERKTDKQLVDEYAKRMNIDAETLGVGEGLLG